jgi:hypothetical protein
MHNLPPPLTASMCPSPDYAKGWNACLAALTREAPTEAVGGEWLVVPKIPTQAMVAAGEEIFAADGKQTRPESVYDAMVHTATPPAPQRLAQGECHGPCIPIDFFNGKACVKCITEHCSPHPTQPPHHDRGEVVERALTAAMREADALHERVGGGTRHYVRDCLLPTLAKHGLTVAALTEAKQQGPGEAVSEVTATIVRDVCETDPADPDDMDTLSVSRDTLTLIVERAVKAAMNERRPSLDAERACSDHPDAPHGFDRNGSHNAGRYVCECEGWRPDDTAPQVEAKRQTGEGSLRVIAKRNLQRLIEIGSTDKATMLSCLEELS